MQRISRIPCRIAESKTRMRGVFVIFRLSLLPLPSGAALPSMKGLSDFLARFQYQKGIALLLIHMNRLMNSRKAFALNISRHQRTLFRASLSVNHGATSCNSRVMSEIFTGGVIVNANEINRIARFKYRQYTSFNKFNIILSDRSVNGERCRLRPQNGMRPA